MCVYYFAVYSAQQVAVVSVQQTISSAQQLFSEQAQVSHLQVSQLQLESVVPTAIAVATAPVKIRAVMAAALRIFFMVNLILGCILNSLEKMCTYSGYSSKAYKTVER